MESNSQGGVQVQTPSRPQPRPKPPGAKRWHLPGPLALAGLGLAGALALVAVANLTHDRFFHNPALRASQAGEGANAPAQASGNKAEGSPANQNTITLPEGKLKAARIETEPTETATLPVEEAVTGMVEANPDRRVEIRPRVTGNVRSVEVQPSQQVKAGDLLVMLDSADVGTARLNVRARQFDLAVARTEAEWRAVVAKNVEALIPELRKGTPASTLEKTFAGKPLGADRAELLAAYAQLEIASHEETKQTDLFKRQIVGEHPVFIAAHTREAAQAKFDAALEQVRFDAAQQKRVADQQVRRAEAAVIDAAKRLEILLGRRDSDADPLSSKDEPSPEAVVAEDVTAYPLVAPFDGTVLTRTAVVSQRAEPTDVLLVLADLKSVFVVANIPESKFAVLPGLAPGSTVRVTAAAYPGRTFEAKVRFTGAAVDPTTRQLRLVAETPNPDGLLRLGMFVQIRIDGPTTERVLTVPGSAVVEVDSKPGVFVPEADGKSFTFRKVTLGRESAGRRVITAGLEPGRRVVTGGAFLLKSELILQNEPDEDE